MFFEIDAVLGDLERRLSSEKSLKNKILLENAIGSLKEFQRNNVR